MSALVIVISIVSMQALEMNYGSIKLEIIYLLPLQYLNGKVYVVNLQDKS